jgi:DNA-binding CsgD family transcriptional regulator
LLAARADWLERPIPYAALTRVIASLAGERDPEVATTARRLAETLDLLGGGPRSDVESSFGRICGQTTSLLRALLERRRVALTVDDLDALDDDTFALLAILVRRLSVGGFALVGTSRTRPQVAPPRLATLLERLETSADLHVVELTAMGEAEIAQVIGPVLDAPPDPNLLREVHARAGGNPFFAREIASSLRELGMVEHDRGRARLVGPTGEIRLTRADAVLQRFVRLDPSARAVLEAIAVVGRASEADVSLLASVTGRSEAEVEVAFDALVRDHLVTDAAGGYAFAHDLLREAFYDRLGPARRRRLHAAVANHLAGRRVAGRPTDVLALARHVAIVAEPGDVEAEEILIEAGDLARRIAPERAAELYGRALELRPDGAVPRAGVLARRSSALTLASLPVEAAEVARAALAVLPPGAERDRTVTTVLGNLVELGRLDEALAVADAEIDAGRACPTVIAQRAGVLWHLQRFDEALTQAARAVSIAVDSPAERLLVLGPLLLPAAYTDRPRPLIELVSEMLRLGRRLPTTMDLYAAALASYALATSGHVAAALPPLQRAEDLVDEVGGTAFRGNILVARVFVDWLQGRWDEAVEGATAALLELEGASFALLAGAVQAIAIEIQTCRGQRPDDDLLTQPSPAPNVADLMAWAVAGVHEAAGALDAARATLAGAIRDRREQTAYHSPLLARRIDVELAAGQRSAAAEVLANLEADVQAHTNPWGRILIHRCRALVRGDVGEARAAAEAAEAGGFAYERARALLVLAELDGRCDAEALDAYRSLQALGADPLRRHAGQLLRRRGLKVPRRRATATGPLTESEMKVAQLIGQGMRNKEIATVLHYSTRTVEVYLSRIYRKLHISSRLELARALDAAGLADRGQSPLAAARWRQPFQ